MLAKDKHRLKLIEYLGNPENEFLDRIVLSQKVLGFKQENQIYKIFTPDEMCEIEKEALAIRRKKYSPEIAKVDKAMLKEAKAGNDKAAKLCYQRFEDWGEKKRVDFEKPPRFEAIVNMISEAQKGETGDDDPK